ncbi:MAG: NAD(P)/FAD-dependent oxidoreductase [Pseudoxanthomonas suwonensis]|nr:NAD(P)/FAD-dependent oxidoreductase [Pseudoxanthomonas suwonensis]
MAAETPDFTIIGAGLAGALLATLLAQRGRRVAVYERRADPRMFGYAGGRSINMALSERGLHALRQARADGDVLAQAVMMRGRMVHPLHGEPHLQRYGQDDSEINWSISRGEMNITLINSAEAAGAMLHFDRNLQEVDFVARTFTTSGEAGPARHAFHSLIGADGAGSTLRQQMARQRDLGERTDWLDHSYKELEIPPTLQGDFRIEPNALHIWPRGRYMCIALPNDEKTFTVTLFLPNEGDPSFATIRDGRDARALFERDFADALPLIPALEADFDRNPVGSLATLYLQQWQLDDLAVLVGDAAHAMVPFHGQGMNCALEDCVALADALDTHADTATAFAAYHAERAANALAIQTMALENYLEMRDHVDDADYQLQRQLELLLEKRHPGRFIPRYSMVTFMRIPYAVAFERGRIQRELLIDATGGHDTLDTIDWARLDAAIEQRLTPLDGNV